MPDDGADLVIGLTYYAPYVSGLTEVARILGEGLAGRGLRVTVVTTRHLDTLPVEEVIAGVRVLRTPVLGRISKGTLSPGFVSRLLREGRRARLVHLHLPLLEAGLCARLIARTTPVILTYHCDVNLPPGPAGRAITAVMDASSRTAVRAAAVVVTSTREYAERSRIAAALMRARHVAVAPPCRDRGGGAPTYRETAGPHIGFLGRLVEEKGIEHLVTAFRTLSDPEARLLVGGDFEGVAGGSVVDRVRAAAGDDPRIRLLGFLPDERIADLYASIDLFALPSVNSLEAFGIVQCEAMCAGVPALASDLPGVREPVRQTGFGLVVPPADPQALAAGLRRLLATPPPAQGAEMARRTYTVAAAVDGYLDVMAGVGLDAPRR